MKHFGSDCGKTVIEGSLLALWMTGCGGLCGRSGFSLLGVVYIEMGWRRQHGRLAFCVACRRCLHFLSIAEDSFTVPSCNPVHSFLALMAVWWQSFRLSPSRTSKVSPTATFWVRIIPTAPSSSSTFSARCRSGRWVHCCVPCMPGAGKAPLHP